MTIEVVFQAICERPEDDDLRLQYADLVESSDPEHASYIRLAIADTIRRRDGLSSRHQETRAALSENKARWAHDLLRFLPRHQLSDGSVNAVGFFFDRGFPTQISIHPLVFIEYADLLFRLAPIRHVRFTEPYDQEEYVSGTVPKLPDGSWEQFPLDQLLAISQLSRLDSFGFDMADLVGRRVMPEDTWARVAGCAYLTRCLALDSRGVSIYSMRNLDALAAGELTGKMLRIDPHGTVTQIGERRYDELDAEHGAHTRTKFNEDGLALEKKHGYIPWLHPSHCNGETWDLAYYVEQGELPKYKPGTPPMQEWYEFPIEVHRRQPWREW